MPKDKFSLIEEQLEVIQLQLRAIAKTLIRHGNIMRQLVVDTTRDAAALRSVNADLDEATTELQAAVDAQTK